MYEWNGMKLNQKILQFIIFEDENVEAKHTYTYTFIQAYTENIMAHG